MGGLFNSPRLLFYHFSLVALCSLRILIRDRCADSIWYFPGALVECVRVFVKSCGVILPFIFLFWNYRLDRAKRAAVIIRLPSRGKLLCQSEYTYIVSNQVLPAPILRIWS